MIEVHGEAFVGEYKWQFRGGRPGVLEDTVCLSLGTHDFAKISERGAFERIKSALRSANVDWIEPRHPTEWHFDLGGLQQIIGARADVPWLNGTMVAKPEFSADLHNSSGTHVGTADFTFYFAADAIIRSAEPAVPSESVGVSRSAVANAQNSPLEQGSREKKVKAAISYSHDDAALLDKLHKHLAVLRREGLITTWTDRDILAGVIDEHVDRAWEEADMYLLLVSASFIDSNYCYEREFKRALKKFQRGEAIIVPVILRECDWQIPELKQFKALPLDGRPVVSRHWHSVDEAFTDVVSGLRKVIEGFPLQNVSGQPPKTKPKEDFVPNETHLNPEHILSDAEREILFECAQDGQLHILKVDAFGSWLRAGRKDFFEQTDPAVQALYLDAFESLRRRGFIRHETGTFYRLTGIGFEEARRIATAKRGQT
jgi:uncharacterized protein YjhX (UPF0386 family)